MQTRVPAKMRRSCLALSPIARLASRLTLSSIVPSRASRSSWFHLLPPRYSCILAWCWSDEVTIRTVLHPDLILSGPDAISIVSLHHDAVMITGSRYNRIVTTSIWSVPDQDTERSWCVSVLVRSGSSADILIRSGWDAIKKVSYSGLILIESDSDHGRSENDTIVSWSDLR